MNTYRVIALSDGLWQVNHYESERLIKAVGPPVTTEAEAHFLAYRLARDEITRHRSHAGHQVREAD